ncbi:MAG: tetratricopeptide repeat protein [Pseudomonadota bacterium]
MRSLLLGAVLCLLGACSSTYQPPPPSVPPATNVPPAIPPVVVVPGQPPVVSTTRQPLPPSTVEPAAPVPAPAATPTSTLLASVQAAITAGDLERGAALSERALRISPRDAQLWYQLAIIRQRQNRLDEATNTARRALSFVGTDEILRRQINLLLEQVGAATSRNAR